MHWGPAMIESAAADDFDSTLIRRGALATTFYEMAAFAETLEDRPLDKLLAELPGIASLSDMKFSLARQVIRRRALASGGRAQSAARARRGSGGIDAGACGGADPGSVRVGVAARRVLD